MLCTNVVRNMKMKKLTGISFIVYLNNISVTSLQIILADLRARGFRIRYLNRMGLFFKICVVSVVQLD